ncbi:group-specific protein [Brevibacillus choshinensis]|uniref:Group-specific protein n=1 Tax=Brevibacillus choshinensis TaxID=54911 RepID=A0ABR5ND74_BRECH|nr:group-specific protein [Brevibacillus choshinensis]
MKTNAKKYIFFQRVIRAFRLNFIKLFRSPGGAKKVSLGFAIGFGLEMIVISTASLIYLLFYPIVRLFRGSLPAAIIGNVIGKLTFLPVLLLPVAHRLGRIIYPVKIEGARMPHHAFKALLSGNFQVLTDILYGGLHVLIGMSIIGACLGVVSYFVIYKLYEKQRELRLVKRHQRKNNARLENSLG